MNNLKFKTVLVCLLLVTILFFSNNFGLLDIEKTAIITAIGIDIKDDKYEITAQIAVPEATDTNAENKKTQLSGVGNTVGEALKEIGDTSGWYPQLYFCNLLVLGKETTNQNCIKMLDYFAKTLRLQDSAVVVLAEGSAKEILESTSPLDNISSFALQKILLKAQGFNDDVATVDIKSFCAGYYSDFGASFMPIVKVKKVEEGDNASGGQSSEGSSSSSSGQEQASASEGGTKTGGSCVFVASNTALYKDGFLVGNLNSEQTIMLNAFRGKSLRHTTLAINDVSPSLLESQHNYLFTILRCNPKIQLKATKNSLKLDIDVSIYGKISDLNAEYSDSTYSKNLLISNAVKDAFTQKITDIINSLIDTTKQTGCDFLGIGEKLYRYNYKHYARYKDNYINKMQTEVRVSLTGQK